MVHLCFKLPKFVFKLVWNKLEPIKGSQFSALKRDKYEVLETNEVLEIDVITIRKRSKQAGFGTCLVPNQGSGT